MLQAPLDIFDTIISYVAGAQTDLAQNSQSSQPHAAATPAIADNKNNKSLTDNDQYDHRGKLVYGRPAYVQDMLSALRKRQTNKEVPRSAQMV